MFCCQSNISRVSDWALSLIILCCSISRGHKVQQLEQHKVTLSTLSHTHCQRFCFYLVFMAYFNCGRFSLPAFFTFFFYWDHLERMLSFKAILDQNCNHYDTTLNAFLSVQLNYLININSCATNLLFTKLAYIVCLFVLCGSCCTHDLVIFSQYCTPNW